MIADFIKSIFPLVLRNIAELICFSIATVLVTLIFALTKVENKKKSKNAVLDNFLVTIPKIDMYCYTVIAIIFAIISIFFIASGFLDLNNKDHLILSIPLFFIVTLSTYASLTTACWKLEINDRLTLKRLFKQDILFDFYDIEKAFQTHSKITIYLSNGLIFKVKDNYNCYPLLLKRLKSENVNVLKEGIESEYCYIVACAAEDLKIYRIFACVVGIIFITFFALVIMDEYGPAILYVVIVIETIIIFIYLIVSRFKIKVNNDKIVVKRFLKQDLSFDFKNIEYVKVRKIVSNYDEITYYTAYLKDGSKFKFKDSHCCYDLLINDLITNKIIFKI